MKQTNKQLKKSSIVNYDNADNDDDNKVDFDGNDD